MPHRDNGFIAVNVAHTAGHGLAFQCVRESVRVGLTRLAQGLELPAPIALASQEFLLSEVHRQSGFPAPFSGLRPRIDLLEPGVAIRMLPAFPLLAAGLQAVSPMGDGSVRTISFSVNCSLFRDLLNPQDGRVTNLH